MKGFIRKNEYFFLCGWETDGHHGLTDISIQNPPLKNKFQLIKKMIGHGKAGGNAGISSLIGKGEHDPMLIVRRLLSKERTWSIISWLASSAFCAYSAAIFRARSPQTQCFQRFAGFLMIYPLQKISQIRKNQRAGIGPVSQFDSTCWNAVFMRVSAIRLANMFGSLWVRK